MTVCVGPVFTRDSPRTAVMDVFSARQTTFAVGGRDLETNPPGLIGGHLGFYCNPRFRYKRFLFGLYCLGKAHTCVNIQLNESHVVPMGTSEESACL